MLRHLVRHALARKAQILIDDLRHGNIANLDWGRLATGARTLSEHPVQVFDGPPDKIAIGWGDDFVCWVLLLTDAPDPDSSDADIVIDVTLQARGIAFAVLDGRSDPPKRTHACLVDCTVRCGPDDPDEACALDDGERRRDEAAAAREWKDDYDDNEDAGVTLWTPPPIDHAE